MKMIQPPTSHDVRSHKCQQVRLGHVWKNNMAYDWRMYLFARRYVCMPYNAFQNQTPPTYHRSTPTAFKTCPAAMLTSITILPKVNQNANVSAANVLTLATTKVLRCFFFRSPQTPIPAPTGWVLPQPAPAPATQNSSPYPSSSPERALGQWRWQRSKPNGHKRNAQISWFQTLMRFQPHMVVVYHNPPKHPNICSKILLFDFFGGRYCICIAFLERQTLFLS